MGKEQLTAQQQSVVENRGGSLLVSAAAGSGKTKVLVERLFRYMTEQGKNIDDFLIITYTRAAAAELRGKIAEELNRRISENPADRHLQAQLFRVYRADIKTVDAFCAALLRENIHLLPGNGSYSLTQDFRVLDTNEAELLLTETAQRVLEQFYQRLDQPGAFHLAETLGAGRDDRALLLLLKQLYKKVQSHAYPQRWLQSQWSNWEALQQQQVTALTDTVYGQELFGMAKRRIAHWKGLLEQCCSLMLGNAALERGYLPAFEQMCDALAQMLQQEDWDRFSQSLTLEFPKLKPVKDIDGGSEKRHSKSVWDAWKKELEKLSVEFSCSQQQLLLDLQSMAPAMQALLELVQELIEAYDTEKLRRNTADFSDQEHWAIRILYQDDGRPTELARRLSQRYTEVLVDEYQDSNEVQNRIYEAVSNEGKTLFAVGDVKQSIYRFRLADPGIFLEHYEQYASAEEAKEGEPRKITLSKNFRSRREVLSAANFIFENILSKEMGDMDYGEDERLYFGAEYYQPAQGRETEFHLLDVPRGHGEDKIDRIGAEAAYVARRIRRLLDEPFMVQGKEGMRPVRPEDIVILLRSPGTRAPVISRALAAEGIPNAVAGSEDYFSATEVMVMVHLLEVLDNPHQDIPLLSLLRSPLVGFDPDRLAAIRSRDKELDWYDALQKDEGEDARNLVQQLQQLRLLAQDCSVDRLLWHIYNEWNVLGIFGAMPEGELRKKRLVALVEHAANFEAAGYKGLFRFVDHLRRMLQNGETPDTYIGGSQSGVQLMSIHKSKGLEFPVVILADLAHTFNEMDYREAVLVHPKLGLGPDCVDLQQKIRFPGIAKRALDYRMKREDRAEELRLLYVAMTRPKEKLIMVGSGSGMQKHLQKLMAQASCPVLPEAVGSCRCYLDWILLPLLCRTEAENLRRLADAEPLQCCSGEDPWQIFVETVEENPQKVTHREKEERLDAPSLAWDRAALDFVYPYQKESGTAAKVTVTQLKGREKDKELEEDTLPPVLKAPQLATPLFMQERGQLSAADRGTVTHLVMQFLDFSCPAEVSALEQQLQWMEDKRLLTPQQRQVVDLGGICAFLKTDAAQRLRQSAWVEREFHFTLLIPATQLDPGLSGEDELMLQGVVDCFWEEADGLHVLDFKTDRVWGEGLQKRAEEYRTQVEQYAAALSRITGKPVAEKLLYFFHAKEMYHI